MVANMRYHFCMFKLFRRFEAARPFTETEAWALFRIAAFGEAIGWTLLIAGILIKRYVMHGDQTAVTIGGRLHGMLFVVYVAAPLVLYPSLGWSRWRALFSLAASVPPYGTLVIEQWAAYKRRNNGFRSYKDYLTYTSFIRSSSL